MVFYIALGSVCSLYFGPKLATSVNLNWAEFTWGINESMTLVPLWAKLLSMIVVVFPALDTLSVFPLISVTLGDNMAAVLPKRWTRGGRRSSWKLLCRFGAALPPLLISMFVSDLSVTLQISGLMGIYVAFLRRRCCSCKRVVKSQPATFTAADLVEWAMCMACSYLE